VTTERSRTLPRLLIAGVSVAVLGGAAYLAGSRGVSGRGELGRGDASDAPSQTPVLRAPERVVTEATRDRGGSPPSETLEPAAYPMTVHVRDAVTHQELSDVVVVHDPERGVPRACPKQPHPGPHADRAVWSRSGRSPLQFRPSSGPLSQYWIGATGYAWARLDLDPRAAGEHVVLLAPAGDLVIHVVDVPVGNEASLRIRSDSAQDELLMEHGVRRTERFTLNGWPTGPCRVQLVMTRHPERVLAEELIDVRSGARADVTLRFPVLEGSVGEVEVTLLLPASDPTLEEVGAETWLALHPLDPTPAQAARIPEELEIAFHRMITSPAEPRFHFWTFQAVPQGSYVAVLHPLGSTASVEVVPGVPARVEMEVEGLARTRVRWRHGDAPEGLSLARLHATLDSVHAEEPEWLEVRQSLEPDGTHLLVSAPGRLHLRALAADMTMHARSIDVVAGWNELELVPDDTSSLSVELVADGVPVPVDLAFWFGVEVTPGADTTSQMTSRLAKGEGGEAANSRARFDFSGPGKFRFRFPAVPGFDDLAPLEREVGRGDEVWSIDIGPRRSASR
jgi:hypothetical protein